MDRLVAARRAGGVVDRRGRGSLLNREPCLAGRLLQLGPALDGHYSGIHGLLVNLFGELVDEVLDRGLS